MKAKETQAAQVKKKSALSVLMSAFDLYFQHFIVLVGISMTLLLPSLVWGLTTQSVYEMMKTGGSIRWFGLVSNGVSLLLYVFSAVSIALSLCYLEDRVLAKYEITSIKSLVAHTRRVFIRVLSVQIVLILLINSVKLLAGWMASPLPQTWSSTITFGFVVVAGLIVEAYFFTAPLFAVKGAPLLDALAESIRLSQKHLKTLFALVVFLYVLRWLIGDSLGFSVKEFSKSFNGMNGTGLFKTMEIILQAIIDPLKMTLMMALFSAFYTKKAKQTTSSAQPNKKSK